jgi:lysophospholipase L1-like esterase
VHGVLALGDSITNGGGELQWGVALQSWAQHLARGLGLPFTNHAVDGATIETLIAVQLPRHLATTDPDRDAYDVGCLYIGVNDVRRPDFDSSRLEARLDQALAFLDERCARVLVVAAPTRLGRPPSDTTALRAATLRQAAAHGALVLDLRDFGARDLVMVDRIHPTAFGQVAIAEQALDVLQAAGMRVAQRPRSLIAPAQRSRLQRLRADATVVYRLLKEEGKGLPGRAGAAAAARKGVAQAGGASTQARPHSASSAAGIGRAMP